MCRKKNVTEKTEKSLQNMMTAKAFSAARN